MRTTKLSTLVISLNLLATNKNCEKTTIFYAASDPCQKKLDILLNLRFLVTSVAPEDPVIIWNLKLVNMKYKADWWLLHMEST